MNKDANIGFQDFIIDRLSGKQPVQKSSFASPIVNESIPVKREEVKQHDILANIAPIQKTTDAPVMSTRESFQEDIVAQQKPVTDAVIPDWLRESTSLSSHTTQEVPAIPEVVVEVPVVETVSAPEPPVPIEVPQEPSLSAEVPELPDWLKGMSGSVSSPEATLSEKSEEIFGEEVSPAADQEALMAQNTEMTDLPPWMQGVDQESLTKEVNEELSSVPSEDPIEDVSSYENIPDWLKSSSTSTPVSADDTPKPKEIVPVKKEKTVPTSTKTIEKKHSSHITTKKEVKNPEVSEKKNSEVQAVDSEEALLARTKKKKPAPVVSD